MSKEELVEKIRGLKENEQLTHSIGIRERFQIRASNPDGISLWAWRRFYADGYWELVKCFHSINEMLGWIEKHVRKESKLLQRERLRSEMKMASLRLRWQRMMQGD